MAIAQPEVGSVQPADLRLEVRRGRPEAYPGFRGRCPPETRQDRAGAFVDVRHDILVYLAIKPNLLGRGPCHSESVGPLHDIRLSVPQDQRQRLWRQPVTEQVALDGKRY